MSDKIILKYTMSASPGKVSICMKTGQILDVQVQGEVIALWLCTTVSAKSKNVVFNKVWTGEIFEYNDKDRFLKTVQVGGYVVHIFILGVKPVTE